MRSSERDATTLPVLYEVQSRVPTSRDGLWLVRVPVSDLDL